MALDIYIGDKLLTGYQIYIGSAQCRSTSNYEAIALSNIMQWAIFIDCKWPSKL